VTRTEAPGEHTTERERKRKKTTVGKQRKDNATHEQRIGRRNRGGKWGETTGEKRGKL